MAPTIKGMSKKDRDFPGGPVVKNLSCNAGDLGSIPGWGTKDPNTMGQISPNTEPMQACRLQLERSLPTCRMKDPTCHN